ncbi:SpoIIE family protein phosphatase [Eubacteriales bacterium OttesenSCG-928-K08]|nr:SpoIIE family protein phosphatase [Eubacteriales bacterium OttesenSCG-928-K08]
MESPRIATIFQMGRQNVLKNRTLIMDACTLAIALMMGRVQVLGALLPFGVALVVALDINSRNVYFPAIGAAIGGLLCGPVCYPVLCQLALYLGARILFPIWKGRLNRLDKLIIASAALIVALPIFYLNSWQDFLLGLSGLAFVLLLCVCFQNGLRALFGMNHKQRLHDEEQLAICLLMGAVALAVADISFYGFSLGVMLAVFLAMFAAYAKGLTAVAAAVMVGGMLLLGGKAQPLLLADIALCTLAAAACRRLKNWGVAAAFCLCAWITQEYFAVMGQRIGFINALPAAALLVVLPKNVLLRMRAAVDDAAREERTARSMLTRLQARFSNEMEEAARTVEQVAELFPNEALWEHNPSREREDMARAVKHICAGCTSRAACWREQEEFLDALETMLPAYAKGMRPRPAPPMRGDCTLACSIAAAAVQARDAYREKCTQFYYATAQHAFANRQLRGVSGLMRQMGAQTTGWPDEDYARIIEKRLSNAGIAVKSVVVQQNKRLCNTELRLERHMENILPQVEESLSRAMERPMRLLQKKALAHEIVLEFESVRNLRASFGSASCPKPQSAVSGDSFGQQNLPGGRALYVLSDGMGSGIAAREQSRMAVEMLIRLYKMGYKRENALECVNRFLMSKGKTDMYATLDALYIDLNEASAEFIKYGAIPSFVLREGQVHTIYAEALPAGILDEAAPAIHTATLKRNDAVVLMTDGALDALAEETAREILRCVGSTNSCEEAAKLLLQAARERSDADDMSVVVVRLE